MILNKDEIQYMPFGRAKDMTGEKINHLTVLGRDGARPNRVYLICECDCEQHNIVSILKDNLVSNKTTSCGCVRQKRAKQHITNLNHARKLNLVGQVFGNLLVVEEGIKKDYHYYWNCQCLICNRQELYSVRTDQLTSGLTICCDECSKYKSMGEITIKKILQENNIDFEMEKRFDDCRLPDTDSQAKFDFFIVYDNKQYIIEYDGKQHFVDTSNHHHFAPLTYIQQHDAYKNNWCKQKNIPIIRIPYTHLSKICLQDLLLETTTFLIS